MIFMSIRYKGEFLGNIDVYISKDVFKVGWTGDKDIDLEDVTAIVDKEGTRIPLEKKGRDLGYFGTGEEKQSYFEGRLG
jgi:hypothetical protein